MTLRRGLLLVGTGLGDAGDDAEARGIGRRYRPRRIRIADALHNVRVAIDCVDLVVNCRVHFDFRHLQVSRW